MKCYSSLVQALYVHELSLDPNSLMTKQIDGSPCLRLRMTRFCKLLQLSQISPISNQHSTSRLTGYVYEHVVYRITVFPIKSIHETGLQISQKILWKLYHPHRPSTPSTPMAGLLSQVGQVGKEEGSLNNKLNCV